MHFQLTSISHCPMKTVMRRRRRPSDTPAIGVSLVEATLLKVEREMSLSGDEREQQPLGESPQ